MKQLSFFEGTEVEEVAKKIAAPISKDLPVMRSWVLEWGKRHKYPSFSFPFNFQVYTDPTLKDRRFSMIGNTKKDWLDSVSAPHIQIEQYPSEWLEKLIDHLERFDSGVFPIPEQFSRMKKQSQEGRLIDEG